MHILGLSAFYHDSAACLVRDGRIIAAAQEERFSRVKHDSSFPERAVKTCLQIGGCSIGDVDYVVFYEKPSAAILTVDGVGEWTTTAYGKGQGNDLELNWEVRFPHSLGLLYTAFTYYLGFKVNSDEYKVMGLAPYGEPAYRQQIEDRLIKLEEDGSFKLDLDYFNYETGFRMTSENFHRLSVRRPHRAKLPILWIKRTKTWQPLSKQ